MIRRSVVRTCGALALFSVGCAGAPDADRPAPVATGAASSALSTPFAPSSLATSDGACVTLTEGKVALAPCTNDASQSFVFDLVSGVVRAEGDPSTCLAQDGDRIASAPCVEKESAHLLLATTWLRQGERCLSVAKPKTPAVLAACDDAPATRFVLGAAGEVRDRAGFCLSPKWPEAGAPIVSLTCKQDPMQRWRKRDDGRWILAQTAGTAKELCLSGNEKGAVLAPCAETDAAWDLVARVGFGEAAEKADVCLVPTEIGGPVQLSPCGKDGRERWTVLAPHIWDIFAKSIQEISLGGSTGYFRLGDGRVFGWGASDHGQLQMHTTSAWASPTQLAVHKERVVAGEEHACVLENGNVACWGGGSRLQQGTGSRNDRVAAGPIEGLKGVRDLAATRFATCALVAGGDVVCWGTFVASEKTVELPTPKPVLNDIVELAAGSQHVCGRDAGGKVACFGGDAWGGAGSGADGKSLHEAQAIDFPDRATRLFAGGDATCAVLASGATSCVGSNGMGAFATGAPARLRLFSPSPIPGLVGATLALGEGHSCADMGDGVLSCWGDNGSGQLGEAPSVGRTTRAPVPGMTKIGAFAVTRDHAPHATCAALADDSLVCVGAVPGFGGKPGEKPQTLWPVAPSVVK